MQKIFNFKPLFILLVFQDNYYMVGSFQDEHTYFLLKEFQHSTLRINFIYLDNHCIFEISLDEYILILYISCSPWQILNFEFLNILRQILNFQLDNHCILDLCQDECKMSFSYQCILTFQNSKPINHFFKQVFLKVLFLYLKQLDHLKLHKTILCLVICFNYAQLRIFMAL